MHPNNEFSMAFLYRKDQEQNIFSLMKLCCLMQIIILNIEHAFTLDILSIAMISFYMFHFVVGFDLLAFIEVVLTKELYK